MSEEKRQKRSRKERREARRAAAAVRKKQPLKRYVMLYFMVLVICILLLLWVFQYFFLPKYYRAAKIRDVISAADSLIAHYSDKNIQEYSRDLAFDHNMFVLVTDEAGDDMIVENNMGDYSFFSKDKSSNFGKTMYQFRKMLDSAKDDYITKIIPSDEFGHDEIFYCTRFHSGSKTLYLFLEAPIEPIDSTVSIIREQLIYISVILFELAFIISVLISRQMARPVEELTETAKKFGEGDYSVEFKAGGYSEAQELATVLDEARNEVKKVDELKKELIANVSHDLRTPLTMVKAYAEMIRDLSGNDPEKREKHCQIIIDESDRLSNLVNSLLELSKLENSGIELSLSNYSIVNQINEVMMRYTLMIEEKGYDISYVPDSDVTIRADRDKLAQVIYNFINNAINYSGDDKHIQVRQINKLSEGVVRIEVSDNGQGIPKDKLSQVFDRYYRGGKVKRETVGTGLGLSICREILKKHEFAFGVISEEGKGSTFWFEAATEEKVESEKQP